ncbi:hypothetical protein N657DRAFT_634448 [Parathielavia appendiculata]|uniref:Uncharacterized protein n=1 Tax=Parathielavia appendiculata TaxID=2587402 RepID=A0AAN6Z2W1_9PEZI|nr:hypothetical protein N657DRAFT_634448 [Parathielavia appendiculata]
MGRIEGSYAVVYLGNIFTPYSFCSARTNKPAPELHAQTPSELLVLNLNLYQRSLTLEKFFLNTPNLLILLRGSICRSSHGQLMRSKRQNSHHAAWKYLKDSCTLFQTWMSGHENWEDAVKGFKMPHIGTRSKIKATEFIEGNQACVPKAIMKALTPIQFQDPKVLERGQGYSHHIPFDDDLTDLVLNAVGERGKLEGKQQESSDELEPSDAEAVATNGATREASDKDRDDAKRWKDKAHATMPRIADTVTETLAAEQTKLLGKGCRQGYEGRQGQIKRQRNGGSIGPPPSIMDTIEESDDNRSPEPSVVRISAARDDEQLGGRKAGYEKLKKDYEELATRCCNLEGSCKRLEEETEHLIKQQKDMRHGHGAGKQDQGQLAQKCSELEAQIKTPEPLQALRLTVSARLDMPTFEPDWDPEEEVYSRRVPSYIRSSRMTSYPDPVSTSSASSAPYFYVNPAGRVTTPTPSLTPMLAPTQSSEPPAPVPAPTSYPVQAPAPVPAQMPTQTLEVPFCPDGQKLPSSPPTRPTRPPLFSPNLRHN